MTLRHEHPSSQPSKTGEEDFEYTLLKDHPRTDGSYKTTDQLHMEYLQLTDELIHQITAGIEVINPTTGEKEHRIPDTVIFLDKSARPVSWLMKNMWGKFAVDENGEVAKMPAIHYLNIDREQWVNAVDPNGSGYMNIDIIDQSIVRSLRSIFVSPKDKKHGLTDEIDAAPSQLDNKTVLIVDEVLSSGRTLDIAQKFLRRAFPSASIAGTYWMKGLTTRSKGLSVGNADLPVWYKEKDEYGRGVGNRLRDPSDSSAANLTQRLGRWFLSTRLPARDLKAEQLRKEFKQLAQHPDVPIRPSLKREDYEHRVESLNGMSFELAQAAIKNVLQQKVNF